MRSCDDKIREAGRDVSDAEADCSRWIGWVGVGVEFFAVDGDSESGAFGGHRKPVCF